MPRLHPIACLLLVLAGLSAARAADRLTVTAPPPAQDAADRLVRSLAVACNSGDFIGFMGHFTPSHGRRIRTRMEDLFVKHQPHMDIRQVTLLSHADDTITFGVKYAWHDQSQAEEVRASKVTARRIDGAWKLDAEILRSITRPGSGSESVTADADVLPANWNALDPPAHLIDPNLEHLRGDVGIRPGRGCANGRCNVR